jgi:prepilin-type N-terminal cleavage/methylation domain-containing protein
MKTTSRHGFTLWEMTIVLLIMAVVATVSVPALARLGQDRPKTGADPLLAVLRDARRLATETGGTVTLRIDPKTARFEVDTATPSGTGRAVEGQIPLEPGTTLVTDAARLRYVFRATGVAFADTVIVRGGDVPLWVGVDGFSGRARAEAR